MKKTAYLLALIIAASFISCKKDSSTTPSSSSNTGSANPYSRDIFTIAGNGTFGYSGDGGQATTAELTYPFGVAVDASGNVYFSDQRDNRIRKVNAHGIISTVAGGKNINLGDGGPADSAGLYYPGGVAVDGLGNIYIADRGNERVRKVNTSGIITTIAGNGVSGYSGDGGAAISAELSTPQGVAVDGSGNIYIADEDNHCIRKINPNGIISTIAGSGTPPNNYGFSGDGGPATAAELYFPTAIAVDIYSNMYIADCQNQRIRKVNASGIISTIAGNGMQGYKGDGGIADSAELNYPFGIAVNKAGDIYFTDEVNGCIRMINSSGIISTIAGNGTEGYFGDGGIATAAELDSPLGIAIDGSGNIYTADEFNYRIRKVYK